VTRPEVRATEISGFDAKPGMPAKVYIRAGEQTFFDFLMGPLKGTLTPAFRKS